MNNEYVRDFATFTINDLALVGGKNASLGEMTAHLAKLKIKIPQGFAVTTTAYKLFIKNNGIDKIISQLLREINLNNIEELQKKGNQIRENILKSPLPQELIESITEAYQTLEIKLGKNLTLALRSSATAEDLPDVSFAGQQETYLNVSGIEQVLADIKKVYASLYTDRAISYRAQNKVPEDNIAMSVGVQQMVRSDKASSGVIFTLDTESGFDQVIFINSTYGLGELLVQGVVNPDEFYVFKPSLKEGKEAIIRKKLGDKHQKLIFNSKLKTGTTLEEVALEERNKFSLKNEEIITLAKQASLIEEHYKKPMDIEWAKDGYTQELYILQARPETVISRKTGNIIEKFVLKEKGRVLTQGRSVGRGIGQGKARIVTNVKEISKVQKNDVLVTDMTDPDWEPVMAGLSAIVTNRGGRTCHAAIVARELGIPAVIGCGTATQDIKENELVTVSCSEGDTGTVYAGLLSYEKNLIDLGKIPSIPVKIMMTVANPDLTFHLRMLPNEGVGLARLEFIIAQIIGIHPKACLEFDKLTPNLKDSILKKSAGYATPVDFYIEKLVESIATIAAAFWPKPVIVRLSDFKSNEYANLLGGFEFEPKEENPMIGFRGASRYIADTFKDCFALECEALKRVRNQMGLTNVEILIPFVRTVIEAQKVIQALKENGLSKGVDGLKLIMMCEVPSNVLLAEQFLEYFDGFSIGSNDLTQLTLGIDRDSELMAKEFDERDPALLRFLSNVIHTCKEKNKSIGICGQGPSDHPDFALWLIKQGIDSISLNPDSVLSTRLHIAKALGNNKQ